MNGYSSMIPGIKSSDTPGAKLARTDSKFPHSQPYDKYTANYAFNTYLIYRPKGAANSTIWVTLSVIDWGWRGTAEYKNGQWTLTDGGTTGGGNGNATSVLPEWSDNVFDKHDWVTIQ